MGNADCKFRQIRCESEGVSSLIDVGAAHGACVVLSEPGIEAGLVEDVATLEDDDSGFLVGELGQADGAGESVAELTD